EALGRHDLAELALERSEDLLGEAGDFGGLVDLLFFHLAPPRPARSGVVAARSAAVRARVRDLACVAAPRPAAARARAPVVARGPDTARARVSVEGPRVPSARLRARAQTAERPRPCAAGTDPPATSSAGLPIRSPRRVRHRDPRARDNHAPVLWALHARASLRNFL